MEKVSKPRKEAKDDKQRDQKFEEQVLKSLCVDDAATLEDKFQLLLRKHVESERGTRSFKADLKTQEKQLETVLREKENLQREYNKSVLMRDKLQEVCREQQKLIKSVKNESMQKIREEEERRKESQSKFQSSLNDITQSLSKNNEENLKLRDHNIEMTNKMKFLAEQYQTRELQLEKLNEQVQLEAQLHQAKLSKVEVQAALDKEILIKEKQIALEKLLQTQKLLKDLSEREKELKDQLHLYTSKYDDFQSSLQKSNDIFATYKVELEKMSKNTKKIEKESLEWKRKWEKSNATLIGLATEKKERDEHAARCSKQVEQLQKLLRALQSERTHLYKILRENNIECPAMPALPPEPERQVPVVSSNTSTTDKDKMEVMSKNCAELKQTLANLQSQMKYLNVKGAEAEAQAKQLQQQEDAIKKRQNGNNKRKQKSKGNKNNNAELTATKATTAVVPTTILANALETSKDVLLSEGFEQVNENTPKSLAVGTEDEVVAAVEVAAVAEENTIITAATVETFDVKNNETSDITVQLVDTTTENLAPAETAKVSFAAIAKSATENIAVGATNAVNKEIEIVNNEEAKTVTNEEAQTVTGTVESTTALPAAVAINTD